MYSFDVLVQPRPLGCSAEEPLVSEGAHWPTLRVPPEARSCGAATFDAALTSLELLPRMYVEPDGSFVWVGESGERWQVDGNLFDRGDELAYIALKGRCPPAEFDALLRCFGWPETPLMFQLSQQGVYMGEATFRAFAERPPQ